MSRKEHWDDIYKEKSPDDLSWYQEEPTVSLSLIKNLFLEKDENIIDVGGGASTLVDYILKEGFKNITVLDLSSNALSIAKQRMGDNAYLIDWKVEDVTSHVAEKKYSLWHDRAVFHFLTEKSDRDKYIRTLEESVRDGGHVIIAAFMIGGPTKCSGLNIVQYDAKKIKNALGSNFNLIKEKPETHLTPAGTEQLFNYYVFSKNA